MQCASQLFRPSPALPCRAAMYSVDTLAFTHFRQQLWPDNAQLSSKPVREAGGDDSQALRIGAPSTMEFNAKSPARNCSKSYRRFDKPLRPLAGLAASRPSDGGIT